ncbi:hypothetical protein GCM10007216_06280 [Thalassobacillus devorans]|uniref:Polysaccharide deacetylase family sporulation protein PdaB n=1 Tax=Thalassobacillus devorans TaxID=279813 RepID=A0ABQ1NJE3_9BACI|nr:LysM peptidoglycan-binding domain-containing protein [Thalassobacillus devorans]NIK27540.1 peptidoglycan/xylan/chitin deacetylase (PgdA/CDA1 family) [Thalassobacillus devorans]GGC78545.1 hypothetical protein GCM10007216_06280 [Thalassobacillus devorans]
MSKLLTSIVAAVLFLAMFLSFIAQGEAAASTFVTKANTSVKLVALTFDDGSDGTNIDRILQVLSDERIPSTFFLTGSGTTNHPAAIKRIAAGGHEVANHSYSHPDFTKLTATQIKTELDRTEAIVKSTTGKTTKPLFRAPFGSVNGTVLAAVGDAGYTHTIHWNIDTLDWKGLSKTEVYRRVVDNILPGSIVLMHTGAGATGTPEALPDIIQNLKAKGYQFATVSQILNLPGIAGKTIHVVRAGDTLYRIARSYGVTVDELAAANNLSNPNLIRIGQFIKIPAKTIGGGDVYTVKAGDTLYSIAKKYNVSVSDIVAANQLANANLIQVGQKLIIPVSTVSYTVKSGDTLYSIARNHGTTVAKIASANNITNTSLIFPGQQLVIPR